MVDKNTVFNIGTNVKETSRDQESEGRRRAIIEAAQSLMVEKGLEGFRVREVAQRAGMHHASMLHYFPNREELIRGVVESIVQRLDRVPASTFSSPKASLQAHFKHVFAQMRDYPEQFMVLNELFLRAARDEDIRRVLEATDASWHNYLKPILEAGIKQGEFKRELNVTATAVLITSFFKGLDFQLGLPRKELERAVKQLERFIFKD